LSSIALFLTFFAMAVHIRFALGRWPEFGEECNTLLFRLHEIILATVALIAVIVAAPLWLILLIYRQFRISVRVHFVQVLLFGAGWALICFAGKYDPTPFTNWFLD
jgi:hypothetical protein